MSRPAVLLTCPSCGGAVAPEASTCSYCNVILQTASCPACFGLNFQGAKHCSHCGGAIYTGRTAGEPAATQHACPRCTAELTITAVGAAFLEECATCSGVWVDADSFGKICNRGVQSAAFVGLGSPLSSPGQPARAEMVQYIPCPLCKKLMNRINFARISGIIVDVCKNHGTWFDRDELRRLVDFIQRGGLSLAERRAAAEAAEQMRELRLESSARQEHALSNTVEHTFLEKLLSLFLN